MLGFLVKKAFFDTWDHFLGVLVINLGFILIGLIPFSSVQLVESLPFGAFIGIVAIGIILLFVYAGAASLMARDIVNYETPEWKNFLRYLKETWFQSLIFGLIYVAGIAVSFVGFSTYLQMTSILGLAAAVFLLWAVVIWVLASQFYFPVLARLDTKIPKILRKSFILFFDNTFFAFVLGFGVLLIAGVSIFTAFLFPGFGGLLVWHQAAMKLRLYKYDYLEENPGANRKKIPWDGLLVEEKEKVGKRTLRGMIFPWKE